MIVPRRVLLSAHMPLHLGEKHDYPWREVVLSFLPIVEEFVILAPETDTDGTTAEALAFASEHRQVRVIVRDWWNPARKGECLADATNALIEQCQGTYHLACQADEVLHENQQASLRGIVESGAWKWAKFGRLNFFGSFDLVNMNRGRWPCDVVRLARRDLYPTVRSFNDATHLGWMKDYNHATDEPLDARDVVQFWHYSYARIPRAYVERQFAMGSLYQFGDGKDPRIVKWLAEGRCDWWEMAPREEFVPVPGPHPAVMREWIAARRSAVESGELT